MIIVGERINSSRKPILRAIEKRDMDFIAREAKAQAEAGANFIDVNAAARLGQEEEDIKWLVETVQGAVEVPLCIDSPNPKAIKAGLEAYQGKALVNSISGESERAEAILPLVKSHGCAVVGLTMDDRGMPKTAQERCEIAQAIVEMVESQGIPRDDIYLDPLVRCISAEADQGQAFLDAVGMIKDAIPGVHVICGLSNISYGLPNRSLLNRAFLALSMTKGLDAAIIDPTDQKLMSILRAARTLLNQDEFCLEYITAHREGKLSD